MISASEGIDWTALHERVRRAEEGLRRQFEPDAAEVEQRLRDRARRLAQTQQAPAGADDEISLLEFDIAGRRLAVDSRYVREVTTGIVPTPMPLAPPWLLGLVYLRGEILTILDFQALTGTGTSGSDGHLLVLAHRGRAVGLMTDVIHGLRAVSRRTLDPVPGKGRFYLGISPQDALVLDGESLFEDDALTGIQAGGPAVVTQGVAR